MELQNQSQEYLSSQNVTNNFSGENQLNFKDTECTFNKRNSNSNTSQLVALFLRLYAKSCISKSILRSKN